MNVMWRIWIWDTPEDVFISAPRKYGFASSPLFSAVDYFVLEDCLLANRNQPSYSFAGFSLFKEKSCATKEWNTVEIKAG